MSLLDQCIAFYMNEKLTYENVLEVLGAVDTDVFSQMLRLVIDGDSVGCLHKLEEIIIRGRDLTQFVSDFTWYLRNLLLVKTSDNASEMIDMSSERMASLREEAEAVEIPVIMRYIRIFSELQNQMRYASGKRVLVEVALIKMTRPAMETDMESFIDRIAALEKQMEKGISVNYVQSNNQTANVDAPVVVKPKEPLKVAMPEDIQAVVDNWKQIYGQLSGYLKGILSGAKIATDGGDALSVVYTDKTLMDATKRSEEELATKISEVVGKSIRLNITMLNEGEKFEDRFMEAITKINFNITEEY